MILRFIGALWCPSCLVMRPRYRHYCQEKGWTMEELDFDLEEATIAPWEIGGTLPVAIILDEQGKEQGRLVGEHRQDELQRRLGVFVK